MFSARELVPLALAVLLLGGVGALARHGRSGTEHRGAEAPLTAPDAPGGVVPAGADAEETSPSGAGARVDAADLGALPLRVAALPAPTRDDAGIRRLLALQRGATYLDDMLEEDSLLVRWPDRTVAALKVWVQPRAPLANWDEAYPQMVRGAFDEWSAAGFPMRFLHVVDSAVADLHVVFTAALPGQQIGLTNRLRDRNGWIVAAEVTIATGDAEGRPFPGSLVAGIARHELGHAFGLGHTGDRTAVMFPEAHTTTIGDADRATLRLLYTLPPGRLR